MARPFARRLETGWPWHKGYQVVSSEGTSYFEMAPDADWNMKIFRGDASGAGLTRASYTAINEGTAVYGEWSAVSRSALTTQQSAYESLYVGRTYNPFHRNSNFYVDSVLRGAGANARVPGVWAPAFP